MTGREMTAHIQSMSNRCRTEARWHVDGRGVLAPLSETGFHNVPTMCCHDPALYSLEPQIQVYRSPCRLSGSSEFIISRLLQCRDLAARAPDVSVVVQSSHRLSSSCRWSLVDYEMNRIDVDVEANALVQRPQTDRICEQICGLCQPHVDSGRWVRTLCALCSEAHAENFPCQPATAREHQTTRRRGSWD